MDTWFNAFESLGFPAAVSAGALWIMWKLAKPISDAYVRGVNQVSEANVVNAEANQRNAIAFEQLTHLTERLAHMVERQSEAVREQTDQLNTLLKKIADKA